MGLERSLKNPAMPKGTADDSKQTIGVILPLCQVEQ